MTTPAVSTIIIMRHAKALDQRQGETDFGRPLAPAGVKDATRMGCWLHDNYPTLAALVSSPALRTRMTVERVVAAWTQESRPVIDWEPTLYLADLQSLLDTLMLPRAEPILLVGHNPGLETLLEYLLPETRRGSAANLAIPPASAYVLEALKDETGLLQGSGKLLTYRWPDPLRLGQTDKPDSGQF